jgi:mannose-6-phosphate isomerase-like protein (cupin superfamily)
MATYFPNINGFRFCFSVVPPENTPPIVGLDIEVERAKIDATLPGMMDHLEDDFMHTTDTIDFEVIISGELYLRLTDGTEKLLKAGDTVVQNGTRHLWRNPGTVPAVMAVFMVGAHRNAD